MIGLMGVLKKIMLFHAIGLISGLCIFSAVHNASAQYPTQNPTQPTSAQLEECERLGIDPSVCSENAILAKQRLMQAKQVQATNSGHVITLSKVSENGQFEAFITWIPEDIGKTNTFRVTLFDPKELGARQPLEDNYDLVVYQGDQKVVPSMVVSFPNGTTEYSVGFPYSGEFTLAVGINDGDEVIEMPILVTPEFPMMAGVSIAVVGLVSAAVMITRTRLFRLD